MGWWFKPANLQTEQFQVAARERIKSPPISPGEAEPRTLAATIEAARAKNARREFDNPAEVG